MSIFDELDKTDDFVEIRGERVDMFAPDLTEATLVLQQTTTGVDDLPEDAAQEQKVERNIRVSVELAKSALTLTIPQITSDTMAAKFIMRSGGMGGEAVIKAIQLCGWDAFYMYTVNRERKEKEDE